MLKNKRNKTETSHRVQLPFPEKEIVLATGIMSR